ncbi:hypothetical protein ETF27_07785 [Prevotella brunnea]|uniref:Uncharacterized protein n=1 Tax=Prevotella brunnea TaxID=2508867 RepID=A0A5C8GG41_9BACT|nr:hypothetical protein [Prevotella brunnea]TXJ60867.1 hypothetical protein ETF27_07785 [Prevotella brunnea]
MVIHKWEAKRDSRRYIRGIPTNKNLPGTCNHKATLLPYLTRRSLTATLSGDGMWQIFLQWLQRKTAVCRKARMAVEQSVNTKVGDKPL